MPKLPHPALFLAAALALTAAAAAQTTQPATQPADAGDAPATMPADGGEQAPTADAVLERFIEATGGRAAYEAVTTRKMTGTLSMPEMGIDAAPITVVQAEDPDRLGMTLDIEGMGEIRTGYDGTIGWRVSQLQGPQLVEGEELEQLKMDADTDAILNFEEAYPTREVVGTETIDGTETYELKIVDRAGMESTRYYAVESGLLVKEQRSAATQMGDVPATITYGDYEAFGDDGLMVPTTTRQSIPAATQVIEVEEVELNGPIDASMFQPPAEVKALMGDGAGADPAEDQDEDQAEAAE